MFRADFCQGGVAESQAKIPNLQRMREAAKEHLVAKVERDLRKWAGIKK